MDPLKIMVILMAIGFLGALFGFICDTLMQVMEEFVECATIVENGYAIYKKSNGKLKKTKTNIKSVPGDIIQIQDTKDYKLVCNGKRIGTGIVIAMFAILIALSFCDFFEE